MTIANTNNALNLSLVNFLNNGKSGNMFNSGAQDLLNIISQGKNAGSQTSGDQGVKITLSEEAQKLLADGGELDSNLTGVQKGAQDFMMSFFDQSDIDLSKLSPDVLSILEGLQGVIGGIETTGRDVSTDSAENRYSKGLKQAYTLMGAGQRLRVAIEYTQDGAPKKLSFTDITGAQVETADITLNKDEDGTMYMTIERTQRQYINGHMTTLDPADPMDIKLYATA